MSHRKKLIEVGLPLEAINAAAEREKSNPFLRGHPRGIHQWWARRPLPVCRAVLLASLIDDPSSRPDEFPTEADQHRERERLLRLVARVAELPDDAAEDILAEARREIARSVETLPTLLDPFSGGASIPLEGIRLGLPTHASDLNPVAVLIAKALVEIPSLFQGSSAIHAGRGQQRLLAEDSATSGLAKDIRYYGALARERAAITLERHYPDVTVPGTGSFPVSAWIWARTVRCPNPACGIEMPLARSFQLANKKGRRCYVEPAVNSQASGVDFTVVTGDGVAVPGTVNRSGATCLNCGTAIPFTYIRQQGVGGRLGVQLVALVVDADRRKLYLSPDEDQAEAAGAVEVERIALADLPANPRNFNTPIYGIDTYDKLFTDRQLLAMQVLSTTVAGLRADIEKDAIEAGFKNDGISLESGGSGARAYADAVSTYLALALDKCADYGNTVSTWNSTNENVRQLFSKQAVQMTWDFVEANPLRSNLTIESFSNTIAGIVERLPVGPKARAHQLDAAQAVPAGGPFLISTDPPYYDNISYAELSDFFYVWLRESLAQVYPTLLSTMLAPKSTELVATHYRFGGDKKAAERFFEAGLGHAFEIAKENIDSRFPLTIYYAFKQSESRDSINESGETVATSTGWETMLSGLLDAGLQVVGTWPVRSEREVRTIAIGANALASSIVLVCRPRSTTAPIATRGEFLRALREQLPGAVYAMQKENIAPVDLAQAAIGPGMAEFSKYSRVVEADGTNMTMRNALAMVNQVLDEALAAEEGDYDASTRWALAWFEEYGYESGPFGVAEVLATAKAVSVHALARDGFLRAMTGRVQLLRREELPKDWNPTEDERLTIWEITQYLVKALEEDGEQSAATLLRSVGVGLGDTARELAYRLYTFCERKGWARDAMPYNGLVVAWPEIVRLAAQLSGAPIQTSFGEE